MQGLAKLAGEHGSIGLIETEEPEPGPGEALVEVSHAGLCGSDLGIYEFEDAFEFMTFPRVMGHEYAGTVAQVGRDVDRFEPGDRVVERIIRHCGECYQCLSGDTHICDDARITGIHHDGAWAPSLTVPERHLQALHPALSPEEGAIVEPTAVAVRAVAVNSRIGPGDDVLVEGPGPIGILAAQVADAAGADVLVSGVETDADHRLPMAADLGFETINVAEDDVEAAAEARTDVGFDVVVDTTGHASGAETAAAVVRKGGQIVVVGQTPRIDLAGPPLVRGEIDVQFSYTYTWEEFETAMDLIAAGDVDTDRFIDRGFSLSDGEAAFEAAMAGETVKPVFDLDDLR
ncbi:MAG: zinc-binding dehydrogenase [Halobacteriales archaeon]